MSLALPDERDEARARARCLLSANGVAQRAQLARHNGRRTPRGSGVVQFGRGGRDGGGCGSGISMLDPNTDPYFSMDGGGIEGYDDYDDIMNGGDDYDYDSVYD